MIKIKRINEIINFLIINFDKNDTRTIEYKAQKTKRKEKE